ncbi:MAG: hypothetical protein LBM19_02565 [Holosporales bacterium]|nr:hypothetical protein [Holosporales bacterium]
MPLRLGYGSGPEGKSFTREEAWRLLNRRAFKDSRRFQFGIKHIDRSGGRAVPKPRAVLARNAASN